jgi:acetyltransferase-like isoleucine patch superfamily enzyme
MGKKIVILRNRLIKLLRVSIFKTFYINFKCLPLKQAIYIPIIIGRGTILRDLSGDIKICGNIYTGMISFGIFQLFNSDNSQKSIITNAGTIIFRGKIIFQSGIVLSTLKTGNLDFGNRVWLGIRSCLISRKKITIGNNVRMSWNVQIIDTDFHYIINRFNEEVANNTKEIIVGNNCWVGNHVSISKGSIVSDGSIVASFSNLKKTISKKPNVIIAGSPAKVVKEGFSQILDYKKEYYYDKLFGWT